MIDAATRRDIVIGVGSSVVITGVGLAVVPLYVRWLGVEAYGLVGFLAVLQSVVALIDLGLAPTASREVARGIGAGGMGGVRPLIANLARLYWLVAAAIAFIGASCAPLIAVSWLDANTLSPTTVILCIVLMAAILALRWPTGLYTGVLIGAHRMTAVSVVNLLVSLGTAASGIAIVYATRRVESLFFINIALAGIQVIAMRYMAWQAIGSSDRVPWSLAPIRRVWRYSAGMAIISVLAVLLGQVDKLVVSSMLSLKAFGIYTLANVVGRALYQLINPIYSAVHPRFSAMVAGGRTDELAPTYLRWSGMFCALFFPASLFLVLAMQPLLELWLHDASLVRAVAPLAGLIAAGSALHGAMFFPFGLQVAHGDVRTPLIANAIMVAGYVPLLIIATAMHGLLGAAAAWPIIMTGYLLLAIWLTHRKLLPATRRPWLLYEVGLPAMICATGGLMVCILDPTGSGWQRLFFSVGAASACALLCGAAVALRYRRGLRAAVAG